MRDGGNPSPDGPLQDSAFLPVLWEEAAWGRFHQHRKPCAWSRQSYRHFFNSYQPG